MLYPTVQEGFGLVPFEAARAGVPCLFAAQTSLAEVLPREAAGSCSGTRASQPPGRSG